MPRKRVPRLAGAALIALLTAVAGCGTSPDKEEEAVRLLGRLGGGELSATCSDPRGAAELQRVMGEWMRSPHPADTLHQTKTRLVDDGDQCEKLAVTLAVERPPALAEIQKVLGRESSTRTESVNLSGSQACHRLM